MRKANREMQFNHIMEVLAKPAKPLLKLVSLDTQVGLKDFLASELERFSRHGYKNEAEHYVRNLDAILK